MSAGTSGKSYEPQFVVPCDSRGVDSFIRGSMIGCAWSLFFPVHSPPVSAGMLKNAAFRMVGGVSTGGLFGGFMGTFTYLSCTTEKLREKSDKINGLIAGLVTGIIFALPTKHPGAFMSAGILCGVMSGAFESKQQ